MQRLCLIPAALLVSLALVGCETTPGPTPSGDLPPTSPAVNCQPTILATSKGEPRPPAGLTPTGFYEPLFDFVETTLGEERAKEWWAWFTTTYPNWAREGWSRVDEARKLPPCAK